MKTVLYLWEWCVDLVSFILVCIGLTIIKVVDWLFGLAQSWEDSL